MNYQAEKGRDGHGKYKLHKPPETSPNLFFGAVLAWNFDTPKPDGDITFLLSSGRSNRRPDTAYDNTSSWRHH